MGNLEKNSKLKDYFEVASETVMSAVFSFIPAGPILDGLLNYRNKLKQKRAIDFSEKTKKVLEEISGKELHAANFETEDFIDVMEAVYAKVVNTRSIHKIEKYRNILVNQIIEPETAADLSLKYVQFIDELSELQILLLTKSMYLYPMTILSFFESVISQDNISKDLSQLYKPSEIEFHLNDLISKGLLQEKETDKRTVMYQVPYEIYNTYKKFRNMNRQLSNSELVYVPTEITISFLKFIELNK